MAREKTKKQIANMVSYCVGCDLCKLKERCDEVKKRPKSHQLCVNMWLKWLGGELN